MPVLSPVAPNTRRRSVERRQRQQVLNPARGTKLPGIVSKIRPEAASSTTTPQGLTTATRELLIPKWNSKNSGW
ncbi:hypothetical protein ACHAQK_007640 [Fusarium lateritium]